MRLVALMIADSANDKTRSSWIENPVLCRRTGLQRTGVKTALQKLGEAGYEMRVSHGLDAIGRPVYAVYNKATDYLVPDFLTLIGEAVASPTSPVDKPSTRRRHSLTLVSDKGRPQHPAGEAVASQGEAVASPLSSSPLTIPSITNGLDLAGPVESSAGAPDQDHDFPPPPGRPGHMTEIERAAWTAAIGSAR